MILDPVKLLADALAEQLAREFARTYGTGFQPWPAILEGGARLAIECIGNSDALYHDAEHTVMATLVGQDILRGRLAVERVMPEDWVHFLLALLLHDIGYCRGILSGDGPGKAVIDAKGATVTVPRGASDAFLAPYHVERSIMFVRHRFEGSGHIDRERLARSIAQTRFPVPEEGEIADGASEPGLVRAADLIGQLADPYYIRKLTGLYYELAETGMARVCGFHGPTDLVDGYPAFFWQRVEPHVGPALQHLERTAAGKQWVAGLYSHVFRVERHRERLGPES